MKTGLKFIDEVLVNGVEKAKINILETKFAGVGKTITMLKIGKNIIETGGKVLFITQDDSIRSLIIKLSKIICESEIVDKEKIKTYINNLSGSFIISKVNYEITNTDLINKLNKHSDSDLIIIDNIKIDNGIDYNLINSSVEPIVFFTKCLSRTPTPLIEEILPNFEVLWLDVKKYENDNKLCDLYYNNLLVGEITLSGLYN